ncbi:Galactokinase [Erysiphe neolycopersici]|uniref:Galactokinase n=1 Tax=Erysiphe neolycopersici TaxID=212602 RepID=A0A420HBL9_9PEZI|nr:Galactokinase [Erysiphe neolycopersici]
MTEIVPITSSLKTIYAEDTIPSQLIRWQNLVKQFNSEYSHPPCFISRSPGRVNIIGEHIDYSLYGVLPMAIAADVLLAVSTSSLETSEGHYKIKLSNISPENFPSRIFEFKNDIVDIDPKLHEWTNYFKSGLRGALEILRKKKGRQVRPKSMEILIDGSVPVGGGLSSSAAFVSASALAVLYANGETSIDKTTLTELAIISERAVGVNSGGMDQSASVFSLRGSALYVSFMPTLSRKVVDFPKTKPELNFLIAQSFVKSDKHVTGPVCYNLRVVECSMAAAYLHACLNKENKFVSLPSDSSPLAISLRGFQDTYFAGSSLSFEDQLSALIKLTKDNLTKEEGYTREEIAKALGCSVPELNKKFMSIFPVRAERFFLRQRAIHVYSEARRVLLFLSLLQTQAARSLDAGSDFSTESFNQSLGDLMNATQDSCRENYACSCPEIENLCTIARKAGAYGSRLTGAGWGGCTVHLVPDDKLLEVQTAWEKEYYSKLTLDPEQKCNAVVLSKPGGGSTVYIVKENDII